MIYKANQLTSFYMTTNLAINELISFDEKLEMKWSAENRYIVVNLVGKES